MKILIMQKNVMMDEKCLNLIFLIQCVINLQIFLLESRDVSLKSKFFFFLRLTIEFHILRWFILRILEFYREILIIIRRE